MSSILAAMVLSRYQYRPFYTPAPLWSHWQHVCLAVPLCLAIAIVYKCARCERMSRVPREAAQLATFIICVLAVVAAALTMLQAALE